MRFVKQVNVPLLDSESNGPESRGVVERLDHRTLVVSWGLPPALNGSSNIVANFARQFSADEIVLAGEKWPGPTSSEWSQNDRNAARIFFLHWQWPWRFKKSVRLLLFPIIFWRLVVAYRRTNCQQILAIFPDEYYLFAAFLLAKITGDRLFTYFHNTYLENRAGIRRRFAGWLQPRVFRRSKIVFVMSEGMKAHWQAGYPGIRFESLVHTFNEEIRPFRPRKPFKEDFKIAFMGNVNKSNLDALSRMPVLLEAFPKCSITTYSGAQDEVFARIGLSGDRVRHTQVGYDQVTTELASYDLLFLAHGFTGELSEIEYETIFPTRTIPYLLSGTPTIAHTPRNAFLTRWLRENDCAEVVDERDANRIVESVRTLIGDSLRCEQIVRHSLAAVEQFRAPVVAGKFRQLVNSVT